MDVLRTAILNGELRAGQPLVEADLARSFGLSKTPVREALKTLAGVGLVTISDYRGALVRVVDARMAHNVFDVRVLLEPAAVQRAVEAGLDTGPAQDALNRAAEAADGAERSMANREFHRLLYAGCDNPVFVGILDSLRDQTALITVTAWNSLPSWDTEAEEHAAILDAARRGDSDEARRLTEAHIFTFGQRAQRALEQLESGT
ncbi:GntR family transcriptional regulator [Micromonospora sp. B11E3]|uniref:GntR family transcriptional regulator n=1 Tax=Micromonospora sp. B11E3 TaxID=3153562 RepID=UPI00325E4F79